MHLSEILEKHNFQIASEEHDHELQEIFEQIPLRIDGYYICTKRRPSYFSFAALRSKKHLTFFTRDSVTQQIASVGCLSLRDAYVQGQLTKTGFFGDMRSHFSRETSRRWRGFYGDLVQHGPNCPELDHCRHFYTTILQPNKTALRAYVEQDRNPFRYTPLPSGTVVNIYGRLMPPFFSFHKRSWRIRHATQSDFNNIQSFLDTEQKKKDFGYDFSKELPRRLEQWPGLNIESFYIVEDSDGRITAATAPWGPGEAQQINMEIMPTAAHIASWASHLLPTKNWARIPKAGEALKILYLTHLQIASHLTPEDQAGILGQLVDFVYDVYRDQEWNFISFPIFEGKIIQKALRGYLYHPLPLHIFMVHPKGVLPPLNYDTQSNQTVGIELSLI